jgi:molybdate transport system substrate-binding protein
MRNLLSAIFVMTFVLSSGIKAHAQSEISFLAPRPMQRALDPIIAKFQTGTNYKVKVTYQGAKFTRQSVAKGQALDVNLIVAPFPGAIASGMLDLSTETPVASFLTALLVPNGAPKPDISTPAAVKKALLAAKSIGYEDPDFTASGQGPWEVISNLGIVDQVATKSRLMLGPGGAGISPTATVGALSTYTQVEKGDLEIGMLLLSDIIPNKDKYDIVGVLPRKISTPIAIVGFLSKKASDPVGAKALLHYLTSPEARAIFKDGGYGLPHS